MKNSSILFLKIFLILNIFLVESNIQQDDSEYIECST